MNAIPRQKKKKTKDELNDELLKTYCIGMMIQEVLARYSVSERLGPLQKIFNTIDKKHEGFEKQIREFAMKKRKKVSEKTILHTFANRIVTDSWKKAVTEKSPDIEIAINCVVLLMAFKHIDELKNIYKLDFFEDFRKLKGCTIEMEARLIGWNSILFANKLIDEIDTRIKDSREKFKEEQEKLSAKMT